MALLGEKASTVDVLPERRCEQACLGAALSNDAAARVVAGEIATAEFASAAHREIHAAICALVAREAGVDMLTVAGEFERRGAITLIPGIGYLCQLAETTLVAAHVREYLARVKELAQSRRLRAGLEQLERLTQGPLHASATISARAQLSALMALLDGDEEAGAEALVHDGASLASLQLEVPAALCEGLIYRGCSSDLVAEVKGGKTTMTLGVSRAMINGEPWCGRTTTKSGVLYLSEQSPHSFVPQVARAGLLGEERFCTIFHRDVLSRSWPEIGEFVLRVATKRGLDAVVVDNLSLWAGIEGDGENDAGVALATLRVIERLTGAGLAVLVLRHARKGGGSISEAGRGSSALAGGFDVLLHLKGECQPRRRRLSVTGRVFAEEPPDCVIELDGSGRYRALGSTSAVKRSDSGQSLLALLPMSREQALTEGEIIGLCHEDDIGKSAAQELLREALRGECSRPTGGARQGSRFSWPGHTVTGAATVRGNSLPLRMTPR